MNELRPCRRVGVEVTRRCNWRCLTCFYRHEENFGAHEDKPLAALRDELDTAWARGCKHAVLVGQGEPLLYPYVEDFVEHCKRRGMTSSVITNGACGVPAYAALYERGLDHLHVSVHGVGGVLDAIADVRAAGKRQGELLAWLRDERLPWRSNTTLQLANYRDLRATVGHVVDHGVRHAVLLGFLPHYHWQTKLREVAVHPAELRPVIEGCAELLLERGTLFTIRYQPFCHLAPRLWPYVTNARYVLYDPWEWEYGNLGKAPSSFYAAALHLGEQVAIQGDPCLACVARIHCGGWNRHYAAGFGGAGLRALTLRDVPERDHEGLAEFGHFFAQNPANHERGWFA